MRALLVAAILAWPITRPPQGQTRLSVVEDLRLDAEKEDFSAVSGLVVSRRGHMAIPLRQDLQVRIYDSTGKLLSRVGRRGSGPGEFRSLASLGWIGDTLWIFDGAQIRTTFVTPDGQLLRTTPSPSLNPEAGSVKLLGFSPVAFLRDGSTLGLARRVDESRSGDWGARVLVRFTPPGMSRVLASPPDQHDERWFMTAGPMGRNIPFAWQPMTVFSPYGDVIQSLTVENLNDDGGTFTVSSIDAAGRSMYSTSIPFRGIRIPSRVADSAVTALAPPAGRRLEGPDLTSEFQALARRKMPKVYSPVQRLTAGMDSTAWVTLRDTTNGRPVLVLTARGEQIATVLLPTSVRLEQASRSHLWATHADSNGLTSIVRYRVNGWPSRR